MRPRVSGVFTSPVSWLMSNLSPARPRVASLSVGILLLTASGPVLLAQTANRITQAVDTSRIQVLANHHPLWANPDNSTGLAPADLQMNQLTLVLSRSPQQEQAFEQFLADQQNPASSDYHHWLTPEEVGTRFGLSDQDIVTVTGWLQSQGLHVNWIAPSRIFIGFGGTAADVGRAFQTEMHNYNVNGAQRVSVSSDPMIPLALAPAIMAIRGLFTIDEHPAHHTGAVQSASPQLSLSNGAHFITPDDFDTIYDVPSSTTGAGVTIGIVSWSRTNPADFDNFKSKAGTTFTDPTEVIPTAYGGVDPGPALTAPPTGNSSALGGQEEATLDVLRAGSVAPGATLLLVVSSQAGAGDGIGADAQYLISTSPVPAKVMNISFGACEASAGPSGVNYWNSLFQTAASEGISVFVSSGDSGADGCDIAFSAPPAIPLPNSPNYICSSTYATCTGGTELADAASPSSYWSSTNGAGESSVLSYIPEGAWNESTTTSVAATGGGVSTVIATPPWQTGTGVPSARTGRYTPDVSFSAASHDGYFACLAAVAGGGCVTSGGTFGFISFSGTSAAAPGMAGVAALLDQKLGAAQGNLNPQLYAIAASSPTAFHDATVSSSGVSGCSISAPSMCNNSIPGAGTSAAHAGFLLGTGYDEVTGLGSLDVGVFLNSFNSTRSTPTVTVTPTPASITTTQSLSVKITVSGSPTATGTVSLNSGGYASAATTLVGGSTTIVVPAGSLAAGTDTLTAAYSPDSASSSTYNSASGSNTVTVTGLGNPIFTVSGAAFTVTAGAATANTSTITVMPANGFTGTVTLTAQVTVSPAGAVNAPTINFGSTGTVNITSASPGTATLTVSTIASQQSSCVASNQLPRGIPGYAKGGFVLACLLLFGFVPRQRKGRSMFGALLLFVILTGGVLACNGGAKTTTCTNVVVPGTTAGSYTITITGTSGSTVASNTVILTVQ